MNHHILKRVHKSVSFFLFKKIMKGCDFLSKKRNYRRLLFVFLIADIIAAGTMGYKEVKDSIPVSYTHLDVYKRQVTGSSKELGKAVGSDEKNHKTTYVTLEGIEKAGEKVRILTDEAIGLLQELPGEKEFLTELLISLCTRRK